MFLIQIYATLWAPLSPRNGHLMCFVAPEKNRNKFAYKMSQLASQGPKQVGRMRMEGWNVSGTTVNKYKIQGLVFLFTQDSRRMHMPSLSPTPPLLARCSQ